MRKETVPSLEDYLNLNSLIRAAYMPLLISILRRDEAGNFYSTYSTSTY